MLESREVAVVSREESRGRMAAEIAGCGVGKLLITHNTRRGQERFVLAASFPLDFPALDPVDLVESHWTPPNEPLQQAGRNC